jgi:hypothetical protein
MKDFIVSLPNPCGEKWENMSSRGCNRHCDTCDKTIYDLAKLTIGEAEALLDGEGEVCVRAHIASDGAVKLADSANANRRMRALVGASLSLIVAACQHSVTPLYVLSGTAVAGTRIEVTGDTGTRKSVRSGPDGRFAVRNLRAGTYALKSRSWCSGDESTVEGIQISKDDVNVGTVDSEDRCIIVGVLVRQDGQRG